MLAASPLMKKEYGIKTGSRNFEIPRDPKIHIVEARMQTYLKFSMQVPKIVNRFGPMECIFVYSVDELFFCLDTQNIFGDKWTVAEHIRDMIKIELGLPCAIGIGENYFQAKICLDTIAKHSSSTGFIAEVSYSDFAEKMWKIPIRDCWGVGGRMERNLHKMGIRSLGDLAAANVASLKRKFGIMGEQLYYHSHGVDLTNPYHKPEIRERAIVQKGFSSGITLLRDYYKVDEILCVILEKSEEVASRAREVGMAGQTISLSIGYSDQDGGGGFSREQTLHAPTNITAELYAACKEIFSKHHTGRVVRQIHVGVTKLTDDSIGQLDLFKDNTKPRKLGYVMDAIRKRHGSAAIMWASSTAEGGTVIERQDKIGGHKA